MPRYCTCLPGPAVGSWARRIRQNQLRRSTPQPRHTPSVLWKKQCLIARLCQRQRQTYQSFVRDFHSVGVPEILLLRVWIPVRVPHLMCCSSVRPTHSHSHSTTCGCWGHASRHTCTRRSMHMHMPHPRSLGIGTGSKKPVATALHPMETTPPSPSQLLYRHVVPCVGWPYGKCVWKGCVWGSLGGDVVEKQCAVRVQCKDSPSEFGLKVSSIAATAVAASVKGAE